MIDAAVSQLDPDVAQRVEEAQKQGKAVLVVNNGGSPEAIPVDDSMGLEQFDPQEAIFSAKITARKL